MKVISGYQTGADIAGILAAIHCGLEVSGYMPKGYKTEAGNKPEYKFTGAVELEDSNYRTRTIMNVKSSDVTIIFNFAKNEAGCFLTLNECKRQSKPHLYIVEGSDEDIEALINLFLVTYKPEILNIAGNRESVSPGIEERVTNILIKVFNLYKNE